jgi:hypothetical protein
MKTIGNRKGGLGLLAKRLRTFAAKPKTATRHLVERNDATRCGGRDENKAAATIERWLSSPELRRPS